MFDEVKIRCYVVDLNTLFTVCKVGFNELESVPTYDIVVKFLKENNVVYCVKSFSKIKK